MLKDDPNDQFSKMIHVQLALYPKVLHLQIQLTMVKNIFFKKVTLLLTCTM